MWSPSMCANLILDSSACFFTSVGLTKHCGTNQGRSRVGAQTHGPFPPRLVHIVTYTNIKRTKSKLINQRRHPHRKWQSQLQIKEFGFFFFFEFCKNYHLLNFTLHEQLKQIFLLLFCFPQWKELWKHLVSNMAKKIYIY